MSETLRWWLILERRSACCLLPLCLALFRRLPDRGYTLSKPFGLLLLGYLFWLLNSLHVLPNSRRRHPRRAPRCSPSSPASFAYRERDELPRLGRATTGSTSSASRCCFFVVFVTAVWLRSHVGDIGGTEQPMDLMFLNAATRADHFPPKDPWLSGHTVAYYYFGYLLVAMIGPARRRADRRRLQHRPRHDRGDGARRRGRHRLQPRPDARIRVAGDDDAHPRARARQPQRSRSRRSRPQSRRRVDPARPARPRPASILASRFNWRPPVFGLAGGLMLVVDGQPRLRVRVRVGVRHRRRRLLRLGRRQRPHRERAAQHAWYPSRLLPVLRRHRASTRWTTPTSASSPSSRCSASCSATCTRT